MTCESEAGFGPSNVLDDAKIAVHEALRGQFFAFTNSGFQSLADTEEHHSSQPWIDPPRER